MLHNASPAALSSAPEQSKSSLDEFTILGSIKTLVCLMKYIYNRFARHMTRTIKTKNGNGSLRTPRMIKPLGQPLSIIPADLRFPSGPESSQNEFSYITTVNWPGTSFDSNNLQNIIDDFSSRDDVWSPSFLDCMIDTMLAL